MLGPKISLEQEEVIGFRTGSRVPEKNFFADETPRSIRSSRNQVRELRESFFRRSARSSPTCKGTVRGVTQRLGECRLSVTIHLVFNPPVREVRDRDISRNLEDRGDPVVQVVEGLLSGDIADREHTCAPWKYASFKSSRNPFSPMMSQIVMSTSAPPLAPSTLSSSSRPSPPRWRM